MSVNTAIDPVLQLGSEGASVKTLQTLLNQQLGSRQQVTVDGVFGARTKGAVELVQYRFLLDRDGVVGTKTWQSLRTNALIETPLLRRGSSGGLVMRVQQVLKDGSFYKGAIDGNFGAQTEDAVKSLQKDRKLVVDGVLGTQTWQAIAELARILTVG
jgi:peptidoglycan hydrolase-like protein with peptidoglycan-binding domain